MSKLPLKFIEKMNGFLKKYGFIASEEYLNNLIKGTSLRKSIIKNGGFDTDEREMFLDLLAKKLTGMEWPCNADPDSKVKEFLEIFFQAVKDDEKSFTIL